MKLLVVGAVVLGGTAALIGTGFQEPIHSFSGRQFLETRYPRKCWIHDGVVCAIERGGQPLSFTLGSFEDPEHVLRVEFSGGPPENFRVGGRLSIRGADRGGKFHAAELVMSPHRGCTSEDVTGRK
jgi:cytochrome c-type biogenesis protein CcmE